MTKKHFIAIAAGFKARLKEETLRPEELTSFRREIFYCAKMFADIAAQENPRFDRARFLSACGF